MDKKEIIIAHIKTRLASLESLGKLYSADKINKLAERLVSTNKTIDELKILIDNKFANEARKINHNNNLITLKEYYIANIEKLKKGNNCYLLSYEKGIKAIEQASIEPVKSLTPFLNEVKINNQKRGFQKENYSNNDYELISSDLAFLLDIPYAKTYRVFDEALDPIGVLHESFEEENERVLNMEEVLQFVKEESSKFTLKSELIEYHDINIKQGLRVAPDKETYKSNIDYVLKLFKALPDITNKNFEQLKKDYLNMKIFELLTNSLNNNLSNIGIIINKKEKQYTYKLSPSYNKCITDLKTIKENETICNFYIVDKRELLTTIINNYYNESKALLTLIADNKETLIELIKNVLKEHLDYESYNTYYNYIKENFDMIIDETNTKKQSVPDTEEDKELFKQNDTSYNNRIAPFVDTYELEDLDNEKGSVALVIVVAIVLIVTILLIGAVILSVSRMDL